jgi:N-methylhydantoinase B
MRETETQIDVNLTLDAAGTVLCRHCGAEVGTGDDPFAAAVRHERSADAAGPGVRVDPRVFTDRPIILRQAFCPGCLTVLRTEVIPGDEPEHLGWRIV